MVKEITSSNDLVLMLTSSKTKLVVVDCYASWCMPCKLLVPALLQLEKAYPSVTFAKLNVDNLDALAAKYNITGMPTLLFFVNGQLKERVVGAQLSVIEATIKKHM